MTTVKKREKSRMLDVAEVVGGSQTSHAPVGLFGVWSLFQEQFQLKDSKLGKRHDKICFLKTSP